MSAVDPTPSPCRLSNLTSLAALAALASTAGCAAYGELPAFSYRFADNQREGTAAIVRRLPAPTAVSNRRNPLGKPIEVVATHAEEDPARELVAVAIDGGDVLWRKRLPAFTRPEILGDVVTTSIRVQEDEEYDEEVVALDLATGRELWRRPTDGLAYVGADRAGDVLAMVVSTGAGGGATRKARVSAVDP